MKSLDISFVLEHSPYSVWQDGEVYNFITDYGILYSVTFEREYSIRVPAYWFNLTNLSGKNSPNDRNVQATIICLIEAFFKANTDVLLYMCDTADNQQAIRARLFMRWFNSYEAKDHYIIRSVVVKTENKEDYVALIIPRVHPYAELISELFDAEVMMYQQNKP